MATRASRLGPRLCELALAVLVACSVASCTRNATQILVVVDTDLVLGTDYECFGILVSRFDQGAVEAGATRRFLAAPGEAQAPFSFGVTPPDGDPSGRVEIAVEALPSCTDPAPTERVVRRAVRTGFLPEQTLRLPLFLPNGCGDGCVVTESCPASGPGCETPPEVLPTELVPVTPGMELSDAGLGSDSRVPDADLPDAAAPGHDTGPPTDAGAPPACVPLSVVDYEGTFYVPPFAVAPRFASMGWRVAANNGSSTSWWNNAGESNAPLLDLTGLSSAGAMRALVATSSPGSDDVLMFGTPAAGGEIWQWSGATPLAATRVVMGADLRDEAAAALLGGDIALAVREPGRPLVLRLVSRGTEIVAGLLDDRTIALAPSGDGGILVALGETASDPGRCEVLQLDEIGGLVRRHGFAVVGTCSKVAVAAIGGRRGVLVHVSGAPGDEAARAQTFGMDDGMVAAPLLLGPAVLGRIDVWPDGVGGYRAVWRGGAAQLRSVAVAAGPPGPTTCITGPMGVDFAAMRSARQGRETFVLVQGGGRGGQGLQFASIMD